MNLAERRALLIRTIVRKKARIVVVDGASIGLYLRQWDRLLASSSSSSSEKP